jgi:hypothetical protein
LIILNHIDSENQAGLHDLPARLLPGFRLDQARAYGLHLFVFICQSCVYFAFGLLTLLISPSASAKLLIYALSSTLAPALALMLGFWLERLRQRRQPETPFWDSLLIFNTSYGVFAVIVGMFYERNPAVVTLPLALFPFLEISLCLILLRRPEWIWRSLIGLAGLALLSFWILAGAPQTAEMAASLLTGVAAMSLPALAYPSGLKVSVWLATGLALLVLGLTALVALPPIHLWLILPAAAISFLLFRRSALLAPAWLWLVDGLTLAWIGLTVIDLSFQADLNHYNAYLGAVNDLLHGKTLLVDAISQYGILPGILIAGVLHAANQPVSYIGLSLINSALLAAQFGILYMLLRLTLPHPSLPALATLTAMAVSLSSTDLYLHPSSGPLRFAPTYLLLACAALRIKDPARAGGWRIAEWIALGIAAIWSVDAPIYSLCVYAGMALYEWRPDTGLAWGKWMVTRGVHAALAVALPLAAFSGATVLRSGALPVWQPLFNIFTHHVSRDPVYLTLPPLWDSWLIIAGLYLISLLLFSIQALIGNTATRRSEDSLAFGVLIAGMAHFVYWTGNSTIESAHILPVAYLIAFWFVRVERSALPASISLSLRIGMAALVALGLGLTLNNLISPQRQTPLSLIGNRIALASGLAHNVPTAPDWDSLPSITWQPVETQGEEVWLIAPDLLRLIHAANPADGRIALLAPLDSGLYALITTHTSNALPISFPSEDSNSPVWRERVDQAAARMRSGDRLIATYDFSLFYPIQQQVIERLCRDFALLPLQTETRAALLELAPAGSAGACTCTHTGMVCPASK